MNGVLLLAQYPFKSGVQCPKVELNGILQPEINRIANNCMSNGNLL